MTNYSTEEIAIEAKRGRGAPPKADPTEWVKVGLSKSEWAQVRLYMPTGTPTEQVREMLETCQAWRKEGKEHKPSSAQGPRRTAAAALYAKRVGITPAEAWNMAWAAFVREEAAKRDSDQAGAQRSRKENE